MNIEDANFGQRLQAFRKNAGLTVNDVVIQMKLCGCSISRQTIATWEKSPNAIGSIKQISWLSFLYTHPESNKPMNVNFLINDLGNPYLSNLTRNEAKLIDDFQLLNKGSKKVTADLITQFAHVSRPSN